MYNLYNQSVIVLLPNNNKIGKTWKNMKNKIQFLFYNNYMILEALKIRDFINFFKFHDPNIFFC